MAKELGLWSPFEANAPVSISQPAPALAPQRGLSPGPSPAGTAQPIALRGALGSVFSGRQVNSTFTLP